MRDKRHKYWKKRVKLESFGWTFDIVLTKGIVSYAKSVGCQDLDEQTDSTVSAYCLYFSEEMRSVIILDPHASPGAIAHECWHAVRRMLLHVGSELENEVVAYHLGYLVDKVSDFMKVRRK